MSCRCAPEPNPGPLYFAECSYGKLGNEFQATDRDKNSRASIVREIRSGGIDPIKILEIDEQAGTCRDVTDELMLCDPLVVTHGGDHVPVAEVNLPVSYR